MVDTDWRTRLVVAEDKLTCYLLVPNHPVGGPKARFFKSIGFSLDNLPLMTSALIEHGRTAPLERDEASGYGHKYTLIGGMIAPNERLYTVKSVWLEEASGSVVRLITAYPYMRGLKDGA